MNNRKLSHRRCREIRTKNKSNENTGRTENAHTKNIDILVCIHKSERESGQGIKNSVTETRKTKQ